MNRINQREAFFGREGNFETPRHAEALGSRGDAATRSTAPGRGADGETLPRKQKLFIGQTKCVNKRIQMDFVSATTITTRSFWADVSRFLWFYP